MIQHRCSQCGRAYPSDEYTTLDRKRLYPEDEDPDQKGGFEKVCAECGAGFHSDRWRLVDEVETDHGEMTVSTVALSVAHGLNQDQWFETLVRHPWGDRITDRYSEQEDAEDGHEVVIGKLERGEYAVVPTGKQLKLEDS